ncbi:MAG: 50S ribosomal protein P1 [Hadesarchaea archaeon]|nr:50S ribosomal protein P1 [Hadesarchaea archaeon]
MEYVYAAMVLHAAGKEITEENLSKVLEAAGVEVDGARVKALAAALEGVDIDEIVKGAAVSAPATPAAEAPEAPKAEGKEKEEKKEEEKGEEEIAGLGALFG